MPEAKADLSQQLMLQMLNDFSALTAQISNLEGQSNLIIAEQQRAAAGRQLMYEKLNKIDALTATVERIAPLVDAHERTHNQALGAMWFGRVLWGVIAGAAGAGIAMLINKLGFGAPPH
jgi:hypothetical protein